MNAQNGRRRPNQPMPRGGYRRPNGAGKKPPHMGEFPPEFARRPEGQMRPDDFRYFEGNNPNSSKYIKNKQNQNNPISSNQKRSQTHISGAKRYNDYLQREKQKQKYREKLEKKSPENKTNSEETETKGTLPSQDFETSLEDKDNLYIASESAAEKAENKAILIRKILVFTSCFIVSLLLSVFSFRVPLTPSHVTIEFSAFGELLAALCIHPIAGIAVVFIKNGIHLLLTSNVPNIANKTILDLIFVLVTYFIFDRTLNSKYIIGKLEYRNLNDLPFKDYSAQCIIFAGLAGSILTAFISILTTLYILLPLLVHFFGDKGATYTAILEDYQNAFNGIIKYLPFLKRLVPSLNSLKTGLFIYNLPLNIFKFFICTIACSFVYPFLNSFTNKERQ